MFLCGHLLFLWHVSLHFGNISNSIRIANLFADRVDYNMHLWGENVAKQNKRTSFSSRLGFVLAAAGSAVGLGNIWRFPYLCAKYGGGIFVIVYLALAVTLGFTLMITEIAIGRKTQLSVVGAYRKLNRKWTFLGYLSAAVPVIITPYYSVIGGWVTKYLVDYVTGMGHAAAQDGYFTDFVSGTWWPILWLLVFVGITTYIIARGVKNGIEKASKFLMPVLVILTAVVAVYCMFQPGASEGIRYVFVPDFTRFSADTVLAAMGQMFYSMSLAMGIMVTYGSYMKPEENLDQSVKQIEWFDSGMAILAAVMIIPAVFVFSGGSDEALTVGPALMFITMPKVFHSMGDGGVVVGAVFFLLVMFAALTSAMSLLETVVSIVRDKMKWGRVKTTLIVGGLVFLAGLPSTLGFGAWSGVQLLGMSFLDFFDFISNSVLMPLVALLSTVFIGFVLSPQVIVDEVTLSAQFKRQNMYKFFVKWIAPIMVAVILIFSTLQGLGFMDAF